MTTDTAQRLIDGQRGQRYGEVLAAYLTDEGIQAHVYGTQMLNDCPQELWEQLDADAIANEMEAVLVKLNGPRYWVLDGLGSKAQPIEPVMREFGGIMMRRIAVLNLGNEPAQTPYTVRYVDRRAIFFLRRRQPCLRVGRLGGVRLRHAGPLRRRRPRHERGGPRDPR